MGVQVEFLRQPRGNRQAHQRGKYPPPECYDALDHIFGRLADTQDLSVSQGNDRIQCDIDMLGQVRFSSET